MLVDLTKNHAGVRNAMNASPLTDSHINRHGALAIGRRLGNHGIGVERNLRVGEIAKHKANVLGFFERNPGRVARAADTECDTLHITTLSLPYYADLLTTSGPVPASRAEPTRERQLERHIHLHAHTLPA